jgi:hypothetical protein
MNYTSVITVGLMTLVAFWWFIRGNSQYKGPVYSMEAAEKLAREGVEAVKAEPSVSGAASE